MQLTRLIDLLSIDSADFVGGVPALGLIHSEYAGTVQLTSSVAGSALHR